MTPRTALQSEPFLTYLMIVGALLTVGAVVIAVMKWGLRKNVDSIWRTYRGWLIIIPLLLGSIFLGRIATIIFLALVATAAFKEFARATGLYRDWWLTGSVYFGIIAEAIVLLVDDPRQHTPGWYGMFMALPVYVIAFILTIPILRNITKGQLQAIALALLGFIYIGWMFGHLGLLADSPNPYGYLLYLMFAVELNDVAAFTFGKLFGRHKMRSEISPNKTWEGSIGALCVSMILPWLLRFSFPHFGAVQLILTGLIVGIGGQLGDLSISFIKRDLGVKDMGATLPGHGGILDRIDSLIFTAPLFVHMTRWFYDLK